MSNLNAFYPGRRIQMKSNLNRKICAGFNPSNLHGFIVGSLRYAGDNFGYAIQLYGYPHMLYVGRNRFNLLKETK